MHPNRFPLGLCFQTPPGVEFTVLPTADRYDITFMSFDNHFETKVLFLMYFGSQIINEYYDDTNNGRMAD